MRAWPKLEHAAPWIAGGVLAAPILALRYPPMSDLPLHEGAAALLRGLGDPAFAPPGLYQANLGHAQQLFDLALAALGLAVPSAAAAKILVALVVAATIGLGARLLRHAGKTPWAALLFAPLAMGWSFTWGFVSNMLGFALLLGALPALDRLAEAPSARRAARSAALVVVLFAAHAAMAACAVIALVVLTAARAWSDGRARARWVCAAPVVTAGALLLVERARAAGAATAFAQILSSRTLWHPLATKLRELPVFVFGRHPAPILAGLAVITAGAVALFVRGRRGGARDEALAARAAAHRFALASAALFAGYLALPYSVNYGAYLYARLLAPAVALAVVAAAPASHEAPRLAKAACVALALATLAAMAPDLAAADAHARAVDALLPKIDRASAVAVLSYGDRDPSLAFNAAALGSRALPERGGRLLFSFAEYPTSLAVVDPAKRWDLTMLRVYQNPSAVRPAHDMRQLRYALVHVRDEAVAARVARAFAPDARLTARAGDFLLFESTRDVAPVDAPELPMREPPPPTLGERARR